METIRATRIRQLKAMHELMILANDEEEITMTWLTYGVPDCPTENDYEFIAEDDIAFDECFDLFIKLIAEKNYLQKGRYKHEYYKRDEEERSD